MKHHSPNTMKTTRFAPHQIHSVPLAAAALTFGWLLKTSSVAAAAQAGEATTSAIETNEVAGLDIRDLANVKVSRFDVSLQLDQGYRAANSVSASRFDAPIMDLPFAIQAFTHDFIDDQRPVNVFDVVKYSPGVTYRANDFNEGNASVAIRGYSVGGVAGSVQILRDGFHGPPIFEFTDVERVEVVKGPASFLYGQVAPGGIVNIITKSPQPVFAATARATYGSYDQYRFESDITGPVSKTIFCRLATSYNQDMDYWKPYDAHSWDIAPSLLWQPSDTVGLTLKYENYAKRESPPLFQKPGYSAQLGVVPTPSDPNLSGVDVPGLPNNFNAMSYGDFRNSDTHQLETLLDLKAGDHWNLRTSYAFAASEIDAAGVGNFGMNNAFPFKQGRRARHGYYTNRDHTGELQGVGEYEFSGLSLRLLAGVQYNARTFDNEGGQAPNDPTLDPIDNPIPSPFPNWDLRDPSTWDRTTHAPLSTETLAAVNTRTASEDKAIYGGVTLGYFDDRLLVLAGARQTYTESRITDYLAGTTSPKITASQITPQYGVLYKLKPSLALFATYSESFVPGTKILFNPDGSHTPARPTQGEGYDIGLKYDLFDHRMSGTLTFFTVDQKNIVNDISLLDPNTGVQQIYNVQSGQQRSEGVELDATITVTKNWQVYLSYSYMDARITEFSGHDAAILAEDPATLDAAGRANYKNVKRFHNAPLQMSAPHLANLWTRYDLTHGPFKGAYFGGGINFVYDQTLLPDTPAWAYQTYTLVNAMVGYSWTWRRCQLSLDLMGKNLTDEYYRPSQSTRCRPREFLVTLTAKF